MAKANRSAGSQLTSSDIVDSGLSHLIGMLEAASANIQGFHSLSPEYQDHFFWACKDKLHEIWTHWERMQLGEEPRPTRKRRGSAQEPAAPADAPEVQQ